MRNLTVARSEYHSDLVFDLSEGMFGVTSKTVAEKIYIVDFENGSCSCVYYDKWRYPCKHMFAVFEFKPEWGFEKLNVKYRENPYITLDLACAYGIMNNSYLSSPLEDNRDDSCDSDSDGDGNVVEENDVQHTVIDNEAEVDDSMAGNDRIIEMKKRVLREKLKKLIDLTYISCASLDHLDQTDTSIDQMTRDLEKTVPTLGGLPLETKLVEAKPAGSKTSREKICPKVNYKELPSRKRKPKGAWKYQGRSGTNASMWKRASLGPNVVNEDSSNEQLSN
jgi:SWIM zinc finger